MQNIINVNNPYGSTNKKFTSKLTFQTGEKFSARVIGTGDSKKEVSLRLIDGWQFSAEVEGDIDLDYRGIKRFVVEGFEDGKLKIKALKGEGASEDNIESSINSILEENGLSEEDGALLIKMLKHNIDLNKENISKIKNLVDFKEKILSDPQKESAFIAKYLNSKSIDINSTEGKKIEKVLKEFFNELKDISIDDLLFIIENDIPLDKESIQSFKNMFKGDSDLYALLKNIDEMLEESNSSKEVPTILEEVQEVKIEELEVPKAEVIERGTLDEKKVEDILSQGIKDVLKMDMNINKDSLSDLTSVLNRYTKNNLLNNLDEFCKIGKINIDDMLEYIAKGEFNVQDFENLFLLVDIGEQQISNYKDQLKLEIKNMFPQELILTENEINNLTAFMEEKTEAQSLTNFKKVLSNVSEDMSKSISILDNLSEESIAKILNIQSKEGLSSNATVKFLMEFVKDAKKHDGLNMFKENLGEALNSTVVENSETLLGVESSKDKSLIQEKVANTISNELLKEGAEAVKNQINIKTEDMKNIIKSILNKSLEGKDNINNILSIIRDNISDFKVFNTVSNQYYYMNLPISLNYSEYPCKIIIKDKREEGKKIDSKDVKMVVTVKTQFLGEVDGFIKVKNNFMNLEIKSHEKFTDILNKKKQVLVESLEGLGYQCEIKVSKKQVVSDIINCREFFNDSDFTALNVMV
ncbi:hypothetical protein [Clostridium amazonitimonense]|uniref:hypothetical protein n=1 Tax=Clostridium amazonitimonense TaxID=1499689 RepID=UPI0005096739|nr:hypothetical protein [Clostridium amazonitimonense]